MSGWAADSLESGGSTAAGLAWGVGSPTLPPLRPSARPPTSVYSVVEWMLGCRGRALASSY